MEPNWREVAFWLCRVGHDKRTATIYTDDVAGGRDNALVGEIMYQIGRAIMESMPGSESCEHEFQMFGGGHPEIQMCVRCRGWVITPSGRVMSSTSHALEDAESDINIHGKRAGVTAVNSTTGDMLYAAGSLPTDSWVHVQTGRVRHVPV